MRSWPKGCGMRSALNGLLHRLPTSNVTNEDSGRNPYDLFPGFQCTVVYAQSEPSTRKPYDHAIDLKPDFKPVIQKPFRLDQKQNEAVRTFIQENLDKGFIRLNENLFNNLLHITSQIITWTHTITLAQHHHHPPFSTLHLPVKMQPENTHATTTAAVFETRWRAACHKEEREA